MTLQQRFTRKRGRLLQVMLLALAIFVVTGGWSARQHSAALELAALLAFVTVCSVFIAWHFMFRCPRCRGFVSPNPRSWGPEALAFRRHCNRCGFDLASHDT